MPVSALDIARQNRPEDIFLSIGFETTARPKPRLFSRRKTNVPNFSILSGNKLTPPAVDALLAADEVKIDGFIIPGHVSAVIGADAWGFIAAKHGRPGVVAGFDAGDLIGGVLVLLNLLENNEITIKNAYTRAVNPSGNLRAIEVMRDVFLESDASWRGIGLIPGSGLSIRDAFADFDAEKKFPVAVPEPREHRGCRCGDLLRGLIIPTQCPLFGKACTPENAVGPCMVSSEGPCSAYYKYWR